MVRVLLNGIFRPPHVHGSWHVGGATHGDISVKSKKSQELQYDLIKLDSHEYGYLCRQTKKGKQITGCSTTQKLDPSHITAEQRVGLTMFSISEIHCFIAM